MDKIKDFLLMQVAKKQLSIEEAESYLETLDQSADSSAKKEGNQEFAVIGMACRLPQANNPDELWDNLLSCRDAVGPFPRNRMNEVKRVNQRTHQLYNGFNCRSGAYFDRIDLFDHSFFKLTPAEARVMDPSQRIFLQVAVEALEDAGMTEHELKESTTGIFVGYSVGEDNYIDLLSKDDPNVSLGNQPSLLAYRLAFLYDMRGPTMVIDTACSSSLAAVHQACQSMEMDDCDQAIVGGVNVRIFPAIREIGNLGIEAYDGRCKSFDASANGTNIGDGVAAIILKKKELAERDGDFIHAVIKGSAINSDGVSNGITAPNPEAQTAVLLKAWKRAGIDPERFNFIEAHGTGTKLGDPIEILGLSQAFGAHTQKKKFCALGALKTNIGHLEATSGIAGLIKAILCLKYKKLPANIHFKEPNPYIDFESSAVYPNDSLKDWKVTASPLLGAVSSFGISGTNCHVVVEESPKKEEEPVALDTPELFLFSAKNSESLKGIAAKYVAYLSANPQVSLKNVSYSLARSRNHYDHRLAIQALSLKELRDKLNLLLKQEELSSIPDEDVYYSQILKKGLGALPALNQKNEVLQLYLQGQHIHWDRFFPEGTGKKIPLPTYVFNERKHWPKLEIEEAFSLEERLQSVFYKLSWIEESFSSQVETPQEKLFLFFIHDNEFHESFAQFSQKQGIKVVRVYSGDAFSQKSNDEFVISPERFEDYDLLLEKVCSDSSVQWGGIVHLWDCLPLSGNLDTYENLLESQKHGAFSAYHLIRAMGQRGPQSEGKFVTLSAYAQKVSEGEDIDPTRMPALGVNKVISQEMPLIQSLAIDLDVDQSSEALYPDLFSEIFQAETYQNATVAFRSQKRYVQILEREDIDKLVPREESLREGGVYLIAGGAGYLGLETALFLARKCRVKVALVGRRQEEVLTSKQKGLMQEVISLGSEVMYLHGDVTDQESCQGIIQEISQKWGAIHGIFVAIKNISHQRIDEVDFEMFSSNIQAKINGTWLLDDLTKEMPVDFMATFSSISSITGGPTGADCCASNLFLDAFGDWRDRRGRSTITMNYTLIDADDGSLLSDRMSMIPPLTKEEFLGCLDVCVTKKVAFAVMADFNSHVMGLVLPFMKVRFAEELLSEFSASDPDKVENGTALVTGKSDFTFEELSTLMKQIWEEVLGDEDIQESANFFDLGGDSISAVKLLHLTKVQLQVDLEISDLYTYPVFEDFCRSIDRRWEKHEEKEDLSVILNDLESGKLDLSEAVKAFDR